MELLAPAGNSANFLAAMEAGADAVYVGAPSINARNLARDLSLEEIYAMVDYCHANGKKIYLAANSLIREQDLPQTIKTLATLQAHRRSLQALDERARGSLPDHALEEPADQGRGALHLDHHALPRVHHPAEQPVLGGDPVDEGPEAHPLHSPPDHRPHAFVTPLRHRRLRVRRCNFHTVASKAPIQPGRSLQEDLCRRPVTAR